MFPGLFDHLKRITGANPNGLPSLGRSLMDLIDHPPYVDSQINIPASAQGSGYSGSGGGMAVIDFTQSAACTGASYVAPSWSAANPTSLTRNTFDTISIDDGIGSFTWVISGTGWTLDYASTAAGANILRAGAGACGLAKITCTDACGNIVVDYVQEDGHSSFQEITSNPQHCYITDTTQHRDEVVSGYNVRTETRYRIRLYIKDTWYWASGCGNLNPPACAAGWPNNELIGDRIIIPPATNIEDSKKRPSEYDCYDWWFCHKQLKKGKK